jgi:hypothetical protein
MPDTTRRGANSSLVTCLFASEHLELLEHRNQQLFTYRKEQQTTRVRRLPWNFAPENLLHWEEGETIPETSGGGGDTLIRVASATVNPTSKMYPAFVETSVDGTPPTLVDGESCWAIGPNNGALILNYYVAAEGGTHSDGKTYYYCAGTGINLGCSSGNTTLYLA